VHPSPFDYVRASTLDHAVSVLRETGPDGKVLAGGCSLIPLLKLRLARPSTIIDIGGLGELRYIRESDVSLHIGALTREVDLERSALLKQQYPILVDTSSVIADPIVRNMGTVGGNLAHGDPANDHAASMVALGAEVVVKGRQDSRVVPVEEFFLGLFETQLAHEEILTEIRIPRPPADDMGGRRGSAYVKIERQVGDLATAGAGVSLSIVDGVIRGARIGLTNVAATVIRARTAEAALVGLHPEEGALRSAAEAAVEGLDPWPDLRGSREYKLEAAKVVTYRALRKAVERASLSTGETSG
jgi:carbon-monoxide dehydrogenase medium subunit